MNNQQQNLSTQLRQLDKIVEKAEGQALQIQKNGGKQSEVLACLIAAGEKIGGDGAVCSILLLDNCGLLRNGSSPKLPADYLTAIDGLKPDPFLGTCASAAATGKLVITKDFKSDDKWAELRHLPLSLGFAGAWSMPIKTTNDKVLGTFGTYFKEQREPTNAEVAAVKHLAELAAQLLA